MTEALFNNEYVRDSQQHYTLEPEVFSERVMNVIADQLKSRPDSEVVAAAVFSRKGYDTLGNLDTRKRSTYSRGSGDDIYLHVGVRISEHMVDDAIRDLINDVVVRQDEAEEAARMAKVAELKSQRDRLDAELEKLEKPEKN